MFPEAAGSIFQVEFERAVRTGRPVQLEEYYAPQDLWVFVRAYPSSFGLAVAFSDISTCRRAQEEARRLNTELEQRVLERTAALQAANQELESFAHAVAHDLRTPMCAARSFTYALQATERGRLSAEALEHVQQIHSSLQYMDDMTEKLLGLAKLSQSTIQCETVDLSMIARGILEGHGHNEPWRKVRVEVEDGVTVFADRVLVTQVLQNLLANAWKFTRDTTAARIAFGTRTDADGQQLVFVEDNGPGFDMQQAKRLFQPFVQLHTDETFGGSGIGLATVKKIISRHAGTVWAEAVAGKGACFYFTLPPRSATPARQRATKRTKKLP